MATIYRTPEQQKARACDLAIQKQHRVFKRTYKRTGETVYYVKSASRKGLTHRLRVVGNEITCDCEEYQYRYTNGGYCSHRAAVYLRLLAEAAGKAHKAYRAGIKQALKNQITPAALAKLAGTADVLQRAFLNATAPHAPGQELAA